MKKNWIVTIGCLLAIAAIFVVSFMLAPKTGADEGEAFGGTDAAVTETLESEGVEPWFKPVLELGSGELESGLFALQAALGAGVLGYAFGNLRGRKVTRRELGVEEADEPTASIEAPAPAPSA